MTERARQSPSIEMLFQETNDLAFNCFPFFHEHVYGFTYLLEEWLLLGLSVCYLRAVASGYQRLIDFVWF